MTKQQLQRTFIDQATKALNKNSKFYSDDLACIKRAASRKTATELRESIARQNAIARTTWGEIVINCQV